MMLLSVCQRLVNDASEAAYMAGKCIIYHTGIYNLEYCMLPRVTLETGYPNLNLILGLPVVKNDYN